MEREELLSSKEYWVTKIQIALFELIENYLAEHNLTRAQLAEKLGVTKGYVSQVLNGDGDHRISKLVELSLACNIAPVISFVNLDEYIRKETMHKPRQLRSSKLPATKPGKISVSQSPAKKKIRA